eukprot:1378267-Amorphochlora_amoeboformis.AAC.1
MRLGLGLGLELGLGLRLGLGIGLGLLGSLGSDYSACLSPRTIDSLGPLTRLGLGLGLGLRLGLGLGLAMGWSEIITNQWRAPFVE